MRLLPVLLACAALPFAAGCGAQDSVKNAVDPVAQAATKTTAAGTVQIAMTGKVSAAGQEIRAGRHRIDRPQGQARRDGDDHDGAGQGEVRIDELLDGLVLYMRSDALTARLPGGKRWVKLDLAALGRQQGVDLGQLQQLGGGSDPTQCLTYLKQSGDVEKLGSDNIKGIPTTHYRATIDFDKVAENAGDAAASVRQLEQLDGPDQDAMPSRRSGSTATSTRAPSTEVRSVTTSATERQRRDLVEMRIRTGLVRLLASASARAGGATC